VCFLTIVNGAIAIDITMNFNPEQENAMGVKARSATVRGVTRKHAAKAVGRRGRRAARAPEAWEQTAQVPDDRDDELDCQRIVQDQDSGRLPRYYDDYN
jgi:acetyl-CoA acetyltransferase